MNIIVQTYDGQVQCRPDTSWEREDKTLYAPDFVSGYGYAPVLFARICKAGKCIGGKFAGRYYDAVNYGLLLYAAIQAGPDGNTMPAGYSTVMDHTSVLPFPMYDKVTLESGENRFSAGLTCKAGRKEEIYSTTEGSCRMIESAIENVSRFVSVRIGDIVAVELAPVGQLMTRERNPECRISGTFCGNSLFDFDIIM